MIGTVAVSGFPPFPKKEFNVFNSVVERVLLVPAQISAVLRGIQAGTDARFTAALQQGPLEIKPDPSKAWQRGYM